MLEWIFNNGGGFDQEARTNWSWEHWSHISAADQNIRREKNIRPNWNWGKETLISLIGSWSKYQERKNIRPNWNWGKETLISLIASWSKYQISQKWSSNQILTSHFISWAANLKYILDIFQKQYMCQRWNSGCRKILVGIYRLNIICIFWWNWLCDKTLTIHWQSPWPSLQSELYLSAWHGVRCNLPIVKMFINAIITFNKKKESIN